MSLFQKLSTLQGSGDWARPVEGSYPSGPVGGSQTSAGGTEWAGENAPGRGGHGAKALGQESGPRCIEFLDDA